MFGNETAIFGQVINAASGVRIGNAYLSVTNLPVFANNAAALAGGLVAGVFYRTNGNPDTVCVVH